MTVYTQFLSMADISQGSVATCLRCGGVFNDEFTANLLVSLLVKTGQYFAKLWVTVGYVGLRFWLTVYIAA